MIAIPQDLPLVSWQNKRNVPLSEGWLAETIDLSASQAGYRQWRWTPEIIKALTYYLRREFHGTLITATELKTLIKASLQRIGYDDIAEKLVIPAPRVVIYLPSLARQSKFELLFFCMLNSCLEETARLAISGVKLEGLREAVKILNQTTRWQGECPRLGAEIVFFTRRKLAQRRGKHLELVIL